MKFAIRLALGLYPRWWRQRYGRELEGLIDEMSPGWPVLIDVMKGGLTMRLRRVRAVPVVTALVGAALGAAISMGSPALHASSTTVRFTGVDASDPNSSFSEGFRRAIRDAVTAAPRANTEVILVESSARSATFRITRSARDPEQARRATAELTAATLRFAAGGTVHATTLDAVGPADVDSTSHVSRIAAGAMLGLLAGCT